MDRKRALATAGAIVLVLAGGWAAAGATMGVLGFGEDGTAVGDLSPVAPPAAETTPGATPRIETVYIDVPAATGPAPAAETSVSSDEPAAPPVETVFVDAPQTPAAPSGPGGTIEDHEDRDGHEDEHDEDGPEDHDDEDVHTPEPEDD